MIPDGEPTTDITLVVYLIDHEIETRMSQIDDKPLTNEENRRLIKAISDEVGDLPPTAQNPVILTTLEIRKRLRKLIEKEFPYLAVLCYQELSPDLNIQPITRISMELKIKSIGKSKSLDVQ